MYQGSRSGQLPFARRVGTMEGAAPHLFRPMYAQANMGHPSRGVGFVDASHECSASGTDPVGNSILFAGPVKNSEEQFRA